jgi:hypothetical protein
MKKLILAGLLVLPLLALPSRAQAWGCHRAFCGPWYVYWPMEANFAVPAPTGYPYWPSPMAISGMGQGGAPVYTPPAPTPLQGPALKPAGYYPQAPAYGYPHY